ncbi:4-alpha-glucanotransferase [Aminivibrio pyruvatiphilus]|uniref:4-alpha-glucanotransferase n=1 Tax=Aminivibrio pyruvatiphilus TaxID=1005740 RepID=A0A4R8M5I5_9BACT|nr:4-alpha-glucanotransferase [Aminivibrio pyruvatiphilus]TDY59492.1 4-alpha-glucanotransferase [Aminivibrio pyruvatiphilus]
MFLLNRACGILLPVPSLPGGFGAGDLGKPAHDFVDFLSRSGQTIWQVLPLTVTDGALGNSPYSSPSAFAGTPLCISPDDLVTRGLLLRDELSGHPAFPEDRIDYGPARAFREEILRIAFSRFSPGEEYGAFLREQEHWLEDYVLFTALKGIYKGTPWNGWPEKIRGRDETALREAAGDLRGELDYLRFVQYIFFSQMKSLRAKCREAGVELIGDLPIYVNYDSADVWSRQSFFCLGGDLLPTEVAGVPPDYFSETGQLWGNPLYNWDTLKKNGFSWWIRRLRHSLSLFDTVRIDHFRGLLAYWAIPFGDKTAERGTWRPVPSADFFNAVRKELPSPPFLAENLGVITPDVTEAMESMGFPGMAVALFAFGGGMRDNPHIPHNYRRELTAYTGTHDNNTIEGWYSEDASEDERRTFRKYTGRSADGESAADAVIRLVLSSVAERAVVPLQDYLGLGSEGRMNTPSVPSGNWEWKARQEHLSGELSGRMANLAAIYGRK